MLIFGAKLEKIKMWQIFGKIAFFLKPHSRKKRTGRHLTAHEGGGGQEEGGRGRERGGREEEEGRTTGQANKQENEPLGEGKKGRVKGVTAVLLLLLQQKHSRAILDKMFAGRNLSTD